MSFPGLPEHQNPECRELIMGKYRIVNRIYDSDKIVILRIVKGSLPLDQ